MTSETYNVQLAIYNLAKGSQKSFTEKIFGVGIDMIPHTGVIVYGREYFYRRTIASDEPNEFRKQTGIHPIQILDIGDTFICKSKFEKWCVKMQHIKYNEESYNMSTNNGNHFSKDAIIDGLKMTCGIPQWIFRIPLQFPLSFSIGHLFNPLVCSQQTTDAIRSCDDAGCVKRDELHEMGSFVSFVGVDSGIESTGSTDCDSTAGSTFNTDEPIDVFDSQRYVQDFPKNNDKNIQFNPNLHSDVEYYPDVSCQPSYLTSCGAMEDVIFLPEKLSYKELLDIQRQKKNKKSIRQTLHAKSSFDVINVNRRQSNPEIVPRLFMDAKIDTRQGIDHLHRLPKDSMENDKTTAMDRCKRNDERYEGFFISESTPSTDMSYSIPYQNPMHSSKLLVRKEEDIIETRRNSNNKQIHYETNYESSQQDTDNESTHQDSISKTSHQEGNDKVTTPAVPAVRVHRWGRAQQRSRGASQIHTTSNPIKAVRATRRYRSLTPISSEHDVDTENQTHSSIERSASINFRSLSIPKNVKPVVNNSSNSIFRKFHGIKQNLTTTPKRSRTKLERLLICSRIDAQDDDDIQQQRMPPKRVETNTIDIGITTVPETETIDRSLDDLDTNDTILGKIICIDESRQMTENIKLTRESFVDVGLANTSEEEVESYENQNEIGDDMVSANSDPDTMNATEPSNSTEIYTQELEKVPDENTTRLKNVEDIICENPTDEISASSYHDTMKAPDPSSYTQVGDQEQTKKTDENATRSKDVEDIICENQTDTDDMTAISKDIKDANCENETETPTKSDDKEATPENQTHADEIRIISSDVRDDNCENQDETDVKQEQEESHTPTEEETVSKSQFDVKTPKLERVSSMSTAESAVSRTESYFLPRETKEKKENKFGKGIGMYTTIDSFQKPLISDDSRSVEACVKRLSSVLNKIKFDENTQKDQRKRKYSLVVLAKMRSEILAGNQLSRRLADGLCWFLLTCLESGLSTIHALLLLRVIALEAPPSITSPCLMWLTKAMTTPLNEEGNTMKGPVPRSLGWLVACNVAPNVVAFADFHRLVLAATVDVHVSNDAPQLRQAASAFLYNAVLSRRNGKPAISRPIDPADDVNPTVAIVARTCIEEVTKETDSTSKLRHMMILCRLLRPRDSSCGDFHTNEEMKKLLVSLGLLQSLLIVNESVDLLDEDSKIVCRAVQEMLNLIRE